MESKYFTKEAVLFSLLLLFLLLLLLLLSLLLLLLMMMMMMMIIIITIIIIIIIIIIMVLLLLLLLLELIEIVINNLNTHFPLTAVKSFWSPLEMTEHSTRHQLLTLSEDWAPRIQYQQNFEVHLLLLATHNQTNQTGSHKNSMSGTKDPASSP